MVIGWLLLDLLLFGYWLVIVVFVIVGGYCWLLVVIVGWLLFVIVGYCWTLLLVMVWLLLVIILFFCITRHYTLFITVHFMALL